MWLIGVNRLVGWEGLQKRTWLIQQEDETYTRDLNGVLASLGVEAKMEFRK